ncbi:hypothetical protein MUP77_02935 [Candidatus Bathyarchaeota archaeon]|nr:hypothetical protein [Candidatus Bathyarchaeota archaeon]
MGLPEPSEVERPSKANKDFAATVVTKHLFGDNLMLKNSENNVGSSYGSKKAMQYDNYVNTQVTASSNFNKSRITGLKDCLMNI